MIKKDYLYDEIFEYFQSSKYLDLYFSSLIPCLIKFLEDIIKYRKIDKDIICEEFKNTAVECDHLEFQNWPQIISYIILHFLTRYQKFQELFLELLKSKL